MKTLKWIGLFILMVSMLVGGIAQIMAWSGTPVDYNAYLQLGIAFLIGYTIIRRIDRAMTAKYSKPIVNARDKR